MVAKEESAEAKGITPAMFHILLSLAEGPQHGYGIGKSIEISSEGNFRLGPGTLYRTLESIRGFGWIRHSKRKMLENDDPRRLYYEITSDGKEILVYELKKLEIALKKAKKLKLLGN
ncbi:MULTISPECIES: PadR family transcriptional regulator [Leptospira]|uniref:Transcriptional regulator, PadR family n=1 Tax=Leptospira weilii str. 2006001853 TaxID=1001589 RepID=A0A828YZ62_9LEPT|nr:MULTISPECIES: helix-turn-helix transcriptional regulator [Leptospira]EKR63509.1 transcriptional regulator, PadR family [Leptospira weilii str. 2006001853]EMJ66106.1 transcriptional regulator, PadR family [Leptospira sp. P2653]EMN46324.1 transcriptional regulator, PadR family [Leptospira weilii str. LNT 1234]OMI17803.1 PadR family transcriptional regulator [Leptospira weilii serovar Heyan]